LSVSSTHSRVQGGGSKEEGKDFPADILWKQAGEEEMLELQIELANEEAEEERIQADRAALEMMH
jgi:hypothetical protein